MEGLLTGLLSLRFFWECVCSRLASLTVATAHSPVINIPQACLNQADAQLRPLFPDNLWRGVGCQLSPPWLAICPVFLQPERGVPIPGGDQAGNADKHLGCEL